MVNHPIAFAVVGVLAVAFAVFEYIAHRQKPHSHGRPPPPPRSPPPSPPYYRKPNNKPDNKPRKSDNKSGKPDDKPGKPDDKSKDTYSKPGDKPGKPHENSPKSNSLPSSNNENSVRYRKPHSERLNEGEQEESNTAVMKNNAKNPIHPVEGDRKVSDSKQTQPTSSGFIKNELQSSSFNDACNQKMDEKTYEKNVFDRLANETKCINKDPKEGIEVTYNKFHESDSESDSDNDSDDNESFHQAVCPAEDSQNEKNHQKEDQMKEAYKREVTDNLMRDIEDGDGEAAAARNAFDDVNVEDVRSRISSNIDQNKCSGCEEMPCNAVVLPCEHCYLCRDCARVVLMCSPKCSVCLADITDFR